MSLSPARRVAFLVLRKTESGGDPGSLLHSPLVEGVTDADIGLATEIVYGTLRWQGELDFVLSHFSRRALQNIAQPLLAALRIGLYQMRHLSRVPSRAAVDQSVHLARRFGPPGGSAFVNAVLRNAARRPESPSLPVASDDPLGFLTATLSHPRWLARRYLDRLGLEAATARCRWNNKAPPVYLRVDPPLEPDEAARQLAEEGVVTQPAHLAPRALEVLNGSPRGTKLHADGKIYIQDAGSQLIAWLLSGPDRTSVWDACAAPGSKATAISRQGGAPLVVATDHRYRRVRLLVELAGCCGCKNLRALVADALYPPFVSSFEHILLDVPCTSLGTLARNPDIKWRVTPQKLSELSDIQHDMLRSAATLLAPGGRLVYATCSTEPEENENVIARFLETNPAFGIVSPRELLRPGVHGVVDENEHIHLLPERDATDGYFAAILTRQK